MMHPRFPPVSTTALLLLHSVAADGITMTSQQSDTQYLSGQNLLHRIFLLFVVVFCLTSESLFLVAQDSLKPQQ